MRPRTPVDEPRDYWPDTAAEALMRWDSGAPLWSRRLAARYLGPFREHALQILTFEIVRRALPLADGGAIQLERHTVELLEGEVRRDLPALSLPRGPAPFVRDLVRGAWNDGWSVTVARLGLDHRILVMRDVPAAPRPK